MAIWDVGELFNFNFYDLRSSVLVVTAASASRGHDVIRLAKPGSTISGKLPGDPIPTSQIVPYFWGYINYTDNHVGAAPR